MARCQIIIDHSANKMLLTLENKAITGPVIRINMGHPHLQKIVYKSTLLLIQGLGGRQIKMLSSILRKIDILIRQTRSLRRDARKRTKCAQREKTHDYN